MISPLLLFEVRTVVVLPEVESRILTLRGLTLFGLSVVARLVAVLFLACFLGRVGLLGGVTFAFTCTERGLRRGVTVVASLFSIVTTESTFLGRPGFLLGVAGRI